MPVGIIKGVEDTSTMNEDNYDKNKTKTTKKSQVKDIKRRSN